MLSTNIDLNVTGKEASITPDSASKFSVEVEDVEQAEILNQIDIEDAVEHYGSDDLLKQIGRDAAIDYFEIEEKEDQ